MRVASTTLCICVYIFIPYTYDATRIELTPLPYTHSTHNRGMEAYTFPIDCLLVALGVLMHREQPHWIWARDQGTYVVLLNICGSRATNRQAIRNIYNIQRERERDTPHTSSYASIRTRMAIFKTHHTTIVEQF